MPCNAQSRVMYRCSASFASRWGPLNCTRFVMVFVHCSVDRFIYLLVGLLFVASSHSCSHSPFAARTLLCRRYRAKGCRCGWVCKWAQRFAAKRVRWQVGAHSFPAKFEARRQGHEPARLLMMALRSPMALTCHFQALITPTEYNPGRALATFPSQSEINGAMHSVLAMLHASRYGGHNARCIAIREPFWKSHRTRLYRPPLRSAKE